MPRSLPVAMVCGFCIVMGVTADRPVQAQVVDEENPMQSKPLLSGLNIKAPTMGGKQVWGDERVFHQWRIQRNALTGHYRLLDAQDRRLAWGTYEHCESGLEKIARERKLQPMRGTVVLLLHGLGRTRGSMNKLRDYLQQHGKMAAVVVGYPSTRYSVDHHAAMLGRVIARMPEVERIDFVAHSLGNIVIRRFLAMEAERGEDNLSRYGRFVMLCPPNHGAVAAERLAAVEVSGKIGGPAIQELGEGWPELNRKLATPTCEFGILCGGRGDDEGFNRMIPGDDDMVIRVATTKLSGARDFRMIEAAHTFFKDNQQVRQYTLRFLNSGHFESEEQRQPLTEKDEP